ncbi:MAG: hypothetical protein ACOYOJ_03405 [Alsobacter sp.]
MLALGLVTFFATGSVVMAQAVNAPPVTAPAARTTGPAPLPERTSPAKIVPYEQTAAGRAMKRKMDRRDRDASKALGSICTTPRC